MKIIMILKPEVRTSFLELNSPYDAQIFQRLRLASA
jgi:hypothetical protein